MRFTPLIVLPFLGLTAALAQTPTIQFTNVPSFGTTGPLTGRVQNVSLTRVAVTTYLFLPDQGWYTEPGCDRPRTYLNAAGDWSTIINNGPLDKTATKIAAYVVPVEFNPPCVFGAAGIPPAITSAALASLTVDRPDPAPPTISFSGLTWVVKSSSLKAYPGPNNFSGDPSMVYVDAQGRLHLRIAPCPNNASLWCASELYTRDSVGLGTYRFAFDTPVGNLDPNMVLGLFTWSENAQYNNREMDIEFSRWGDTSNTPNAQFVVQPYNGPNNIHRFVMPTSATSTHSFVWSRNSIDFQSLMPSADFSGNTTTVDQWGYTDASGIPPQGDAKLHINFYLNNGTAPTDGVPREIILSRVDYFPAGPSLSLSTTSVNVPFTSSTGTINVTATDNSCTWTATSNIPWLTINSGASGTGSGAIAYTVADNVAAARNGSLTFASTNCNLTPGQQQFFVSQAPVQCTFSFSPASNNVSAAGGTFSTTLSVSPASCPWNYGPGAGWLTWASPYIGGLGTTTLYYTVLPNQTTSSRTATLSVSSAYAAGNSQSFSVTQAAGPPCYYSLNPAAASASSNGGTSTVLVGTSTSCPWTASSNVDWIQVTLGSTGSGAGPVTYTVAPNPLSYTRLGTLTIAGITFSVTQPPDPANSPLLSTKVGIFRPYGTGGVLWVRDRNGDGLFIGGSGDTAIGVNTLGTTGDQPLVGDWNGTGTKKLGIYRPFFASLPSPGLFVLDVDGNEVWNSPPDRALYFPGQTLDVAVVGHWNGGSQDQVGVFRNGMFYLDVNGDGTFSKTIRLGLSGDIPVVGDWNGDGRSKVGIFRDGLWVLDYNGNGQWDGPVIDRAFYLGASGDQPLTGDWNGDGRSKAGVFRAGLWVLDYNGNGAWDGIGLDRALYNGVAGDIAVVGDWTGDGKTKGGIFHQGIWFLDVVGDGSFSRLAFLGQAGDLPIVGKW